MENSLDKIKLNQNLWFLLISFLSLGFSEYYELPKLIAFSLVSGFVALMSVIITTFFYTIRYSKK